MISSDEIQDIKEAVRDEIIGITFMDLRLTEYEEGPCLIIWQGWTGRMFRIIETEDTLVLEEV